ncbi:hypothetical protein [Uliginosibacterium sp. H1]|uniref:hypothetical protein n=1 Tax=Uliginosibacterium sp. H1 TaxID=3114757 RepID=UPI002E17CCF0|nr:hypothetical protein [Uliginosibacterium sp. H1]
MRLLGRFLTGLAYFGDKLGSVGMLWGVGVGAAIALFHGKMFAGLLLAALAAGIFMRLKRGRTRR